MEKTYLVTGEVKMRIGCDRFKKEVKAATKERAVEKALSNIGGCHKVKRYPVKILAVEELAVVEQ